MKLVDLVIEVGRAHRSPSGVWCVPVDKNSEGSKFIIHEDRHEYECVTCKSRWEFKR